MRENIKQILGWFDKCEAIENEINALKERHRHLMVQAYRAYDALSQKERHEIDQELYRRTELKRGRNEHSSG